MSSVAQKTDADIIKEYLASQQVRRLHLGAGRMYLKDWLNTDLEGDGKSFVSLDATRPFPLPDNSMDRIYTEHMIEHVQYPQFVAMLAECYRVMREGAHIRIVTPSIDFLISLMERPDDDLNRRYTQWAIEKFTPYAPRALPAFVFNNFVRAWGHKFIYDEVSLTDALIRAGFRDVRREKILESKIADLRNLERTHRMPDGFLELESMIVEATK